jgi:two-component system NtrC family sensor kinase
MILKHYFNSLSGKLFITIGILIALGAVVFGYFLFAHFEKTLLNNSIKYGHSFSNLVNKSAHYGMLTAQGQIIQETIESIGSAEGVQNVRIFDSKGRISYSSNQDDIGTMVDQNSPICTSCHSVTEHTKDTPSSSISRTGQKRILNIVKPIYNEPACYTAACHVHQEDQRVLGLIEADLSLDRLDTVIRNQRLALTLYVAGFLLVISISVFSILRRFVAKPVTLMAQGMERVAGGDLDYHLEIDSQDEIGELANAFNAMTYDLKKAKNELLEWGHALEEKVQDEAEKIKEAHSQMIHSEKLSSLGRMAAGVAHEINSPLTGIVTFGHLLRERFPSGSQELEDIDVIIEQANRCSAIIKGLLGFARASSAEKTSININDIVMSALNIVRNKADFFDIQFITDFDEDLPFVRADASQLQQVFLNMIMNAADAMEKVGTMKMVTRSVHQQGKHVVEVEFNDTGPGIRDQDIPKLFEPFFTTKPVGKGTGLGLAVSHGIIQEHGGEIRVKTELGEGTSFFIRLPLDTKT